MAQYKTDRTLVAEASAVDGKVVEADGLYIAGHYARLHFTDGTTLLLRGRHGWGDEPEIEIELFPPSDIDDAHDLGFITWDAKTQIERETAEAEKAAAEAADRRAYLRLKAKFEPPPSPPPVEV